jgi:hypothetical protein
VNQGLVVEENEEDEEHKIERIREVVCALGV